MRRRNAWFIFTLTLAIFAVLFLYPLGAVIKGGFFDENGRFINQLQVFALLVLHLFDVVGMKGTGTWTIKAALDLIVSRVDGWYDSFFKPLSRSPWLDWAGLRRRPKQRRLTSS